MGSDTIDNGHLNFGFRGRGLHGHEPHRQWTFVCAVQDSSDEECHLYCLPFLVTLSSANIAAFLMMVFKKIVLVF
jgi:hypothetical protein